MNAAAVHGGVRMGQILGSGEGPVDGLTCVHHIRLWRNQMAAHPKPNLRYVFGAVLFAVAGFAAGQLLVHADVRFTPSVALGK